MKGKIDKEGILYIERAGKLKNTYCPYQVEMISCCDECPLFGEPEVVKMIGGGGGLDGSCKIEICNGKILYFIEICNGKTLNFEELIDEREEIMKNGIYEENGITKLYNDPAAAELEGVKDGELVWLNLETHKGYFPIKDRTREGKTEKSIEYEPNEKWCWVDNDGHFMYNPYHKLVWRNYESFEKEMRQIAKGRK